MRSSLTLLLSAVAASSAFSPAPPITSARRANADTVLRMSSPVKVPVTIAGDNVDLTPALSDYVNQKVDRTLGKLSAVAGVSNCDVFLSVNKNPKVKSATVEVVTMIKGTTFRVAETSPDMYASIDLVANRLGRKLRKYKERRLSGYHGGPKMGENLADALRSIEEAEDDAPAEEEGEDFVDPEQAVVTKIKSFDLSKGISVREAIFALDYIDHDFYVFRDEESDEVSVVYKRNAGGVGLIQPEQ